MPKTTTILFFLVFSSALLLGGLYGGFHLGAELGKANYHNLRAREYVRAIGEMQRVPDPPQGGVQLFFARGTDRAGCREVLPRLRAGAGNRRV